MVVGDDTVGNVSPGWPVYDSGVTDRTCGDVESVGAAEDNSASLPDSTTTGWLTG